MLYLYIGWKVKNMLLNMFDTIYNNKVIMKTFAIIVAILLVLFFVILLIALIEKKKRLHPKRIEEELQKESINTKITRISVKTKNTENNTKSYKIIGAKEIDDESLKEIVNNPIDD